MTFATGRFSGRMVWAAAVVGVIMLATAAAGNRLRTWKVGLDTSRI